MKKSFWSDEDGFSIKDFYGISFTVSFIAICWLAVYQRTNQATFTVLGILSPIILTILGGYIVTEGAKTVLPKVTTPAPEETKTNTPAPSPAPTELGKMNDKV